MSIVKEIFTFPGGIRYDCYIVMLLTSTGKRQRWFRAIDVISLLDYKEPKETLYNKLYKKHRISWTQLQQLVPTIPACYWRPRTVFISEAGLQEFLEKSTQPRGVFLHEWLTDDKIIDQLPVSCICEDAANENERLKIQLAHAEVENEKLTIANQCYLQTIKKWCNWYNTITTNK